MKRVIRRSGIAVIVAMLAFAIGVFASKQSQPTIEAVTEHVQRRNLVQTVEATGEVESADDVDVSFGVSGDVKEIFVRVGDKVTAGTLLASLDTSELVADAENARKAVEAAQANLAAKNAGNTSEALATAQAAVSVAQAQLASAQAELTAAQQKKISTTSLSEASLAAAEATRATRETALVNTQASAAQDTLEAQQDFVSALYEAAIAVRSSLSDADEVLGIDNSLANDEFEDVLSAVDNAALQSANTTFELARASRNRMEPVVFALSIDATAEQITNALTLVTDALKKTETTLLDTRKVLDATILTTATFTPADLSALKTSIDAARADVLSNQTALLSAQQRVQQTTLATTVDTSAAQSALTEAERAYAQSLADQENTRVTLEASIRSAQAAVAVQQASVTQAQAQLAEVAARPRSVDLAALVAEVERTRAVYDGALARLAKAEIRAPIDGTVTEVNVEAGELAGPSLAAVTVESDGDRFKLVVNIAESDITKVHVDNPTDVTFDAFGDDVVVHARVSEIDPAEHRVEGVVFYQATIALEDGLPSTGLKPGMSADVTITTATRENVIAVPQRSVLERASTKYVRILEGTSIEERTVTTGLRADGGFVEILSGLNEAESLVVTVRQ